MKLQLILKQFYAIKATSSILGGGSGSCGVHAGAERFGPGFHAVPMGTFANG